jgi:Flp pilus assembly pilin Flp
MAKRMALSIGRFLTQPGQTMTEYALILSALAVVVFVGYQTMGTRISTLLGVVDGRL